MAYRPGFAPLIFSLFTTFASAGFAAETGIPQQEAFDDRLKALPPGFTGNSCQELIKPIRALPTAKDEFESTAAYNARLAKMRDTPLAGSVTLDSLLAFNVSNHGQRKVQYDADTGILKASYYLGSSYPDGYQAVIDVRSRTIDYLLSDIGYGIRMEVQRTREDICAVGLKVFTYPNYLNEYTIEIKLDPERARAAKENLGVLFVGRPSAPYIGRYEATRNPRPDNLYSYFGRGDKLLIDLKKIYVFDKASGEIYKVIKI